MKKYLLLAGLFAMISLGMNAQVTLYYSDFESATSQTMIGNLSPTAVPSVPNWEFVTTTGQGRLRTTGIGISYGGGSNALILDATVNGAFPDPENKAIFTFDMSSYTTADSVELDLWIYDDGEEFDAGDGIWMRGDNTAPWILVESGWGAAPTNAWTNYTFDVDGELAAAGQNFSSTFQVRVGQMDNFAWGSDGIAIDAFHLYAYEYGVNFTDANVNVCWDATDGYAVCEAALGVAPYTYAWSTGATGDSIGGLSPGTYCVTSTDANGDTTSSCIEVVGGDSIFVTGIVTTPLICKYDVSEAQAVASGGSAFTGSYAIDTNSANFNPDTSQIGTTVALNDYDITLPISIGFDFEFFGESKDQFRISSDGWMTFNMSQTSSNGSAQNIPNTSLPNDLIAWAWEDLDPNLGLDGTVSYYVTGTAPFRVLHVNYIDVPYWLGAIGDVTAQVKLFETTSCIEIHTTQAGLSSAAFNQTQGIENSSGTDASVYPGRNQQQWEAINSFISFCPLDSSGLLLEWSSGDVGSPVFGLEPGTYTVSATDVFGCEGTDQVVVDPAPSNLTLDPIVTDVSCGTFGDGAISSNQTGGVAPITYAWDNGQTTADINNLDGGSYTVVATDNLGCIDSVVGIMVEEPSQLLSSVYGLVSPVCPDEATGSASVAATGGRTPYSYGWSDGQVSATASGLVAGSYQVTVTDSSGCESVQAVNMIAEETAPNVDLGGVYQSTNGIGITLTAGNYPSVVWSTGETTQSIVVAQTGTYWAAATNAAGCTGSDTTYVEIWPNGINETADNGILSVYPNPTQGQLTLNLSAESGLTDVQINVMDIHGKVVFVEAIQALNPNQPFMIDVDHLAKGVYNLSIQSENLAIERSFVKQ